VETTDVLIYQVKDRKAYITLNRPHRMNALSQELLGALKEAFQEADADENVFTVILSGAGGRAFSAGADLKDMASRMQSEKDSSAGQATPPMTARPQVARGGFMPGFDDVNM